MGFYTEYIDKRFTIEELQNERKAQLKRIQSLRENRDVLVMASDIRKSAPTSIEYGDLLPFHDQLSGLNGDALDLIIESPGGSGETAEEIVRVIRDRYDSLAVIVPGTAKSAATMITMAADEILMGPISSLGPIDAQIFRQDKRFSAHALLEGMDKIKDEVETSGRLNAAYIPILKSISPGEIQSAENSLSFAKDLVTKWLAEYKFRAWTTHSSTGKPVTDQDRRIRAEEIAEQLCDHSRWKTHGRSLRIKDLESLRLIIENYESNAELFDAIQRYYTLLQLTFDGNAFKLFETIDTQIYRFKNVESKQTVKNAGHVARFQAKCNTCEELIDVQANLDVECPIEPGFIRFPTNDVIECPSCSAKIDIGNLRTDIESRTGQRIL